MFKLQSKMSGMFLRHSVYYSSGRKGEQEKHVMPPIGTTTQKL